MAENKTLWYVLGCIVAGAATCIISLLIGLIFFNWAFEEPEDTIVYLHVPANVTKDETFRLAILVENLKAQPKTINSVEFSPGYLAGIRIEDSAPPFIEAKERPYSLDRAYTYNLSLEPGEILAIEFTALAQQAGEFSGELDVCLDGMVRCLSYAIQTTVVE